MSASTAAAKRERETVRWERAEIYYFAIKRPIKSGGWAEANGSRQGDKAGSSLAKGLRGIAKRGDGFHETSHIARYAKLSRNGAMVLSLGEGRNRKAACCM